MTDAGLGTKPQVEGTLFAATRTDPVPAGEFSLKVPSPRVETPFVELCRDPNPTGVHEGRNYSWAK